jgi:hypothetical protein
MTDILTEAHGLIYGNRQHDYGSPLENWQKTADLVNAMLAHKLAEPLTAEDLVLMMVQVKIAREIHKPKHDSRVDGAGYFGVLDMIVEERKQHETVVNPEYEMATTPLDYPILSADDRAELAAFTKQTPR